MVYPPNRTYFLQRVQGVCQACSRFVGLRPPPLTRQMRRGASTLCNHEAWLVPTLVGGKMRWGSNNRKSWSNSSWFFAVVSYLGTAVKRRIPEFPLHHIRMQEDRIFRRWRISWTIFPAISSSRALRWTCHVICSSADGVVSRSP